MAKRAFPQRVTCELFVSITIVRAWRRWRRAFVGSYAQELAAIVQLLLAVSIAQKPAIANAVESTGENVKEESPNELFGRESPAFCSEPRPRPCPPSLPIPNISAPRSASSPCSTLGDKISSFIPTYIVSSRVAESHPMVAGGFLAAPVSSCPYGCCPVCSADCS